MSLSPHCRECLWILTGGEGTGLTLETLTSGQLQPRRNTRIQLTLTAHSTKVMMIIHCHRFPESVRKRNKREKRERESRMRKMKNEKTLF
jgi:hypothetical protein